MVEAVHAVAELTTPATDATGGSFETALTLDASTLSAAGFVNNDEALLLAWWLNDIDTGTTNAEVKATYGGSDITDASEPRIVPSPAEARHQAWMNWLDLGTLADLDLDMRIVTTSGSTVIMNRATLVAVLLDEFGTEDTDWFRDALASPVTNHGTTLTDRCAVTIADADDWIVVASFQIAIDATNINWEATIAVDGTPVGPLVSEEGEGTSEEITRTIWWPVTLDGSSHDISLQTRDDATGSNDVREARIFVFRASEWPGLAWTAPSDPTPASATDVVIASVTDSIAAESVVAVASAAFDIGSSPTPVYAWIEESDTAIHPTATQAAGIGNAQSRDNTDQVAVAVIGSFDHAGGALDLDFHFYSGAAGDNDPVLGPTLIAWGMNKDVGSPIVVSVGTASESDTAVTADPVKPILAMVGAASESDTAEPVGASKSVDVGTATETETAVAVAPVKVALIGSASESDTAEPVLPVKPIETLVGTAPETDTAVPVGASKSIDIGAATETDLVEPVDAVKPIFATVGTASEAETARPVTGAKTATIGVASESDTAEPVGAVKVAPIGTAPEVDTTILVAPVKVAAIGTAPETDTAVPVVADKPIVVSVTPATELDSAETVVPVGQGIYPIDTASEVDLAETVDPIKPISAPVGTASEADTAEPTGAVKVVAMGTAPETDTAEPVDVLQPTSTPVETAVETDTAEPVSLIKPLRIPIGVAVEADAAAPVVAGKVVTVGVAVETDTAQTIIVVAPLIVPVGTATELDVATAVSRLITTRKATLAAGVAAASTVSGSVAAATTLATGTAAAGDLTGDAS